MRDKKEKEGKPFDSFYTRTRGQICQITHSFTVFHYQAPVAPPFP
jgi:hypothetical protein